VNAAIASAAVAGALRVRVQVTDVGRREALERLFALQGHRIVGADEPADIVVADADAERVLDAAREAPLEALLTPRELEVLRAMARGLTNKMIARDLDISPHTVKFHVESLLRKLGVRSRTEAVGRAMERLQRDSFEA
jgi:DNA-binding NarL/FixJ family response regulator